VIKLTAFLLLAAASASAGPVAGGACGGGTLADYISLGAMGCTFGVETVGNIIFIGTNGGVAIDPALLAVNLVEERSGWFFWTVSANIPVAANAVIDTTFSYTVGGMIGGMSTFILFSPNLDPTQSTYSWCLNGSFSGAFCTGTPLPLAGAALDFNQSETMVSFRHNEQRSGAVTFQGIQTTIYLYPLGVPEPGTLAAAALGILLLFAGLWRKQNVRQ